jgi:hypothetical protein
MWTGIIALRIGAGGESCVCGDEHLSSTKCEEFSGIPEQVLASPVGFSYMELFGQSERFL